MATRRDDLYERDFYAWTRVQARELRRLKSMRPNVPLDLGHLAEEIRDLGSEQVHAIESQLERLIEHLLKLAHSRHDRPRRQWMLSVNNARSEIERRLTPSIRRRLPQRLPKLYAHARDNAVLSLEDFGDMEAVGVLPDACPYSLAELLDRAWLPPAPTGLRQDPSPP